MQQCVWPLFFPLSLNTNRKENSYGSTTRTPEKKTSQPHPPLRCASCSPARCGKGSHTKGHLHVDTLFHNRIPSLNPERHCQGAVFAIERGRTRTAYEGNSPQWRTGVRLFVCFQHFDLRARLAHSARRTDADDEDARS